MTDLEKDTERWKEALELQNGVSWKAPFSKLKYKYENSEWNQIEPNLDMFKSIQDVKNVCGNGDSFNEVMCWLDTYHWSIMNKSKLTEDIYQFISHRATLIRKSIDDEIDNFHINWDIVLSPAKENFIKNGSNLMYFIFQLL